MRAPQVALRDAASDYIGSVAERRLDASRRASVEVMAKLSDDELVELRLWTAEQIAHARDEVATEIESCDFWVPETPGLSPSDVTAFSGALMPKPKRGLRLPEGDDPEGMAYLIRDYVDWMRSRKTW